jgi:hypothetical protein
MLEKINPNVHRILEPIIRDMTSIHMLEMSQPLIGSNNRGDQFKREKQACVHMIFNGSSPYPECQLEKTADDKLRCKICGREIYSKFDGKNVEMLLDARKVVEQVMFFGMVNNMTPEIVQACIDMKKMLPDLAQVTSELNEFVKREESNNDAVGNIGEEYRFNNITSMY